MGAYAATWVTEHLAVGGAPMSYAALDALRAEGVDCILNLCAEFCDLREYEEESGFEVYYLPIPDEEIPDLTELESALEWMDEAIYLGKKVLIHCRHGIGRTGTVLNAYLLRKGLGHKLAGRRLKPLRAKPQNFAQWRFVRRYGKKERRLTIREPSLEARNLVDLYPFFADYERAVEDVDVLLAASGEAVVNACGAEHSACCSEPVTLSLVEAVYVAHAVNMALAREYRLEVIDKAVEVGRLLRRMGYSPDDPATMSELIQEEYRKRSILCPLNRDGECLIFDQRPLACRKWDLTEQQLSHPAVSVHLPNALRSISANLFFAYSSAFPQKEAPSFPLADVLSGKFVQTFFHALLRLGA